MEDIEATLKLYEDIHDVSKLGLFMNEINLQCSSLMVVKNRLFLYKIQGYPFLTNVKTGETVPGQPIQYSLTTEPFQIIIDNIMGVAKALSDTVHTWHKYNMNLNSKQIDLYMNGLSLRNTKLVLFIQLLTVILAISLSAFFLIARDPFDLIKDNYALKQKNASLKLELEKEPPEATK